MLFVRAACSCAQRNLTPFSCPLRAFFHIKCTYVRDPFRYGISLFHCMQVGLREPGGAGLGAAVGVELLSKLIEDAGFQVLNVHSTIEFLPCDAIVAEKP